jgi:hypothetical protein
MAKSLLPDDFSITPEMRAWARFKIPHVNIDHEHENFCDYWRAHGKKMADWTATWRVWMRRVPEFSGRGRNTRSVATVEMPYERGQRPTIGKPVQLRDHPLFKGVK